MTNSQRPGMRSLAFCGVIAAIGVVAQTQQAEDILRIDQPIERDYYAAHREVSVLALIDGDLVAAGSRVTVDGHVSGDILVAAQEIEIRSDVSDDVRAAGQRVRITSPVSGHVVAAGQSVTIEESVGDWAWLAGTTVEVLGDVGSDLKIRGSKVTINAEVAGDVDVGGNELELGPEAVIRGNLTWRSDNEANINAGSRKDGEFIEEPQPGLVEELGSAETYSLPIKMIVAVTVLLFLFSRPLQSTLEQITTHPGGSIAIGLAVFLVTPFVAVL